MCETKNPYLETENLYVSSYISFVSFSSFKKNRNINKYQSKYIRTLSGILTRCPLSATGTHYLCLNFSSFNLELNSKLFSVLPHMLTAFMRGWDDSSKQSRHKRMRGWQTTPLSCCWMYFYFSLWHTTGNSCDSAAHFSGTVPKLNYNLGLKISV